MTWYDPILAIINLASKKPTANQWYAALQAIANQRLEDHFVDDTTINNATTAKHGLMPKLDGFSTHFYRSDGAQAVPPGLGGVTGAVDGAILLADGVSTDTIKTSSITIVTTLGADDTTVPTSKAVKNVTDGKAAASHTHTEGDVTNLTTDLAAKAPLESPAFTGTVTTPAIKITGGSPGVGKVLTSDADGDATWTTVGGGDVVGPASATDGHMAVFNGVPGN